MPCEYHTLVKKRKDKPNEFGSFYGACTKCPYTIGNIIQKKSQMPQLVSAEKALKSVLGLIVEADDLLSLKERIFGKVDDKIDPAH